MTSQTSKGELGRDDCRMDVFWCSTHDENSTRIRVAGTLLSGACLRWPPDPTAAIKTRDDIWRRLRGQPATRFPIESFNH
eukprot:4430272-Amphidinium_carterae.1